MRAWKQAGRFAAAALLSALMQAAAAQPFTAARPLRVVTDINFPPYLFQGEDGQLQGILKDKWDLWSASTGVPVRLEGIEWKKAQEAVLAGGADVIEALSYTEARASLYEYSPPYAPIEARVYFHRSISGVNDPASLRGFRVAAKAGSACGNWLAARGVKGIESFADSEALVRAAGKGDVRLFCMDAPAAQYFLYKLGLEDEFRQTPPLYTTHFHWAVAKGRAELRDFIQAGYASIPAPELEGIDARWLGQSLASPDAMRYARYAAFAALAWLVIAALLWLWNRTLRRRVAARTAELGEALASLQKRAAEVRDLYDNAPCGYHSLDAQGRFIEINRTELGWLGCEREALVGRRRFGEFLAEESRARFLQDFGRFKAEGNVRDMEFELVSRDGSRRTVLLSATAVYDAQGGYAHSRATLYEITERMRAERALQASRQSFEALFRTSPTPARIFARSDNRTLECNAAYCALVGYAREEILGRSMSDLKLFPDAERNRQLMQRLHEDGRLDDVEFDIATRSGETRRVLGIILPFDWQGEPAWMSQLVNITERQRAERALRESEARFASMFHDSPAALTVSSWPEGRFLDINRAALELIGYSREQLVGRTSSESGLYAQAAQRAVIYESIARDGFFSGNDIELRRGDGALITVQLSGRTFQQQGERTILWCIADITDQLRAQHQIQEMNEALERTVAWRTDELSRSNAELKSALEELKGSQDALLQSEKLAALGRLVAGIAHELNTPIGNSLLSATALAEYTDGFAHQVGHASMKRSTLQQYVAQTREASGILARNLEKAAELIRSFKQVAADQTSSQRRGFALKEVVDEVLLAHRPMLRKSPIRVAADIPEAIRLDSYPGPLGQVLGNLITNAVLHGYEGSSEGMVTVLARTDEAENVEIAVVDEGRGIPEGDLKRIFDPFFTTRMGRGGTGLGLGICHSIVTEALGGTIRVQSRPGQGSTFTVRIPLTAPLAPAQRAA